MPVSITSDWKDILKKELEASYMKDLNQYLLGTMNEYTVYPPVKHWFNALNYTSYKNTKVVILGQDPYHGDGQAHGLSFSVQPNIKIPPSLRNIYKELSDDLGCSIPKHGCLTPWAMQGVLLLNTVLTVQSGQPNSHKGMGWERFTESIIEALNKREEPVVFILWGKYAQAKISMIDASKHFIISSPHPSPFAARKGFFGSKPFSRANEFLNSAGSVPVNWVLPESVDI